MSLPVGTVTFLFTDIEGSTRLLERFGDGLLDAMGRHQELLADAVVASGGVVFETVGDAVYAAFARPADALRAAIGAQRAIAAADWGGVDDMRIRAALHRGDVERRGAHYVGAALFRASRVLAMAHGGQTLATGDLVQACVDSHDLPPDASFEDLGKHRLRDLREPETVWQVRASGLPDTFPPLRSSEARLEGIPRPRSTFIGRGSEVRHVVGLLESERLVTLTGPAGIGKTRLALEVARQAAARETGRFPDGAVLIDLTGTRSVDDVPATITSVLALRAPADEAPEQVLGEWLRHRRMLLLVDNCEHVIEMSPLIARLLDAAADLVVLATSRERLRLRGERVVEVPPMRRDVGEGDAADALAEGILLFCDRAAIDPRLMAHDDATIIAAICDRLDGLPLAIELAAARTDARAPTETLHRLEQRLSFLRSGPRDFPERHRTLAAALDWSVDLLEPDECTLFGRLGVFAGGWMEDAAEAVCEPLPDGTPTRDAVDALVDKSLVRRTSTAGRPRRYDMLETIREASVSRLKASGEQDEVRARHLAWAVSLMEAAEVGRWGSEPQRWVSRIDEEVNDIAAAFAYAGRQGDDLAIARIVGASWRQVELMSRHFGLVGAWTEDALTRIDPLEPRVQARVMICDAILTYYRGGHARALERLEVVRELLEPLAPSTDLGDAYLFMGEVLTDVDPDTADSADAFGRGLEMMEAAEAVARAIDDHTGIGAAANSRAIVLGDLGRSREALAEFDRAVSELRTGAPGASVAAVVISRAMLELQLGMTDAACASIRECLDEHESLGLADPWLDAFYLLMSAGVAIERSAFATAGRLVGAGLLVQSRTGMTTRAWQRELSQARIALDAASGGMAEALIALGATMSTDEAFELLATVVADRPVN